MKAKSTLRSSRHRTDWKRNGPWFCFSVDTDAPDVKPDVPQDTSNSSSHCSASRYSAVGDLVIAVFFRFLIRFSFDFLAKKSRRKIRQRLHFSFTRHIGTKTSSASLRRAHPRHASEDYVSPVGVSGHVHARLVCAVASGDAAWGRALATSKLG